MKLLKEFESLADAEALENRLRAKGILTHISSAASKQLGAIATGATKVGVWAVLNEQVDDAVALLGNNKHIVKHFLAEEEMKNLEIESKSKMANAVKSGLNKLAIAIVLVVTTVVAYNVLSES